MDIKFDISEFVKTTTIQSIEIELVKNVKAQRKELKISQRLLAQKSGVSYASIRRFESTGDISLTSLLKIATALNCLDDFRTLFASKQIKNLKDLKIWLKI